jgi:hypothetical protein
MYVIDKHISYRQSGVQNAIQLSDMLRLEETETMGSFFF